MAYMLPMATLIQTKNAANQTAVTFTTGITAAFTTYLLIVNNLSMVDNGASKLCMQMSINGGSSYDTSGVYAYSNREFDSNNGNNWNRANNDVNIQIMQNAPATSTSTDSGGLYLYLYNPSSSTFYKNVQFFCASTIGVNSFEAHGTGNYQNASPVNAFQLIGTNGNIMTGQFSLYGLLE